MPKLFPKYAKIAKIVVMTGIQLNVFIFFGLRLPSPHESHKMLSLHVKTTYGQDRNPITCFSCVLRPRMALTGIPLNAFPLC